jgi:hypothetical protein
VRARRRSVRSLCAGIACLFFARAAIAQDEGDYFIDRRGDLRSFDREYRVWITDREPYPIRAAAEALIWVGLGTAYYWLDPLANSEDWDDPSVFEKLRGDAVSFDNNLVSTNFVLHPLAGAAVYGSARVNGLSVPVSFAYAAASSVAWEFVLEWREQASVNDLIFTSIGGASLGEFLSRLSDYASSAGEDAKFGTVVAAHTIGLPHKIHQWIDGPRPRTSLPADALGFSSAYWHRFSASYGFGEIDNDAFDSSPAHSIDLEAQIVAIPGFLRPGRINLGFDEANFTEGRLRLLYDTGGLAEVDARVSSTLFGHLKQEFTARSGSAALVGLGTGLRYYDSWRLGRRDGFAFVHLPGPVFGIWSRSGALRLKAQLNASFDFAGIRPLGFGSWEEVFDEDGLRSVLTRRGYTYAWCGSSRARLAANNRMFGVGAHANAAWCRSIQGLDRFENKADADVTSIDTLLELEAWAGFRPPGPVELRFELEQKQRGGWMGQLAAKDWDRRAAAVVAYVF